MIEKKRPTNGWKPGQSGNPKGRVPGVERVRKMLDPHSDQLIAKAVELALGGDTKALRLCIERIAPLPRAESPPVSIPGIASGATMSDKARAVLDAVGAKAISPDTAAMLLSAIASATRIIEADELTRQLEELRASMDDLKRERGNAH